MPSENIAVVLVAPQGAGNIGSVSRAMLNFGLTDLRLVNPQVDHVGFEAKKMAVKAADLLTQARVYASLGEALADCSVSFGTTRRFGRYREGLLHPDEAAQICGQVAAEATAAFVFGREDKGLLTEELDLCQHFITIPTDDRLPSMNLSHAVALCLYELRKNRGEAQGRTHGRKRLAPNRELEALYQHMRGTLVEVGYLDPQNPDHILRTYRRIIGRAGLNEREVRVLRGLFNQIDVLCGNKPRRRNG